ncbi:hypothetical protein [Marinobacter sp. JSM 1782161]|uniref:hypothetical protein n=1 Tax=Marinobacter sp. JSM 1782161 TaxID=2685906 RepID=UPI001403CF2E|nr:hypothetical protein [Marinobacter sp. JSM 1782161]
MKPDDYNPMAREAFGRTLIDVGVSIFKSIILLFTVVPLAAILEIVFRNQTDLSSIFEILGALSGSTQLLIIGFLIIGFFAGHWFRKEGLRHLHELEE